MAVTNDIVTDQRVHKVCLTLVDAGYSVTLIGRKLPNSLPLANTPYKTRRIRLLFTTGILFYAFFNIRLFFMLLFSKADIFTANDLDTLAAVFFAAKIRRKAIMYDSHEYFTEVPELENNKFARNVWTKLESFIFPRLKIATTVCQSIADIYSEKYNVSVNVVRNVPLVKPVLSRVKPDKWKDRKIIIYQGAVNVARGIELMIETVSQIENALFLVIGGGDKLNELKDLVEEKKLEHKVVFTGKLHYTELAAYTYIADCGISIEEPISKNYYYALPNKLFDYIHASVPVVVSDLPEMRRIIEKYSIGAILPERSAACLAETITMVINKKWDENVFEFAKTELSWEYEKNVLLQSYQKICSVDE